MTHLTKTERYLLIKEEDFLEDKPHNSKVDSIWANDIETRMQIITNAVKIEIELVEDSFFPKKDFGISSVERTPNKTTYGLGAFGRGYSSSSGFTFMKKGDFILKITEYKKERRVEI